MIGKGGLSRFTSLIQPRIFSVKPSPQGLEPVLCGINPLGWPLLIASLEATKIKYLHSTESNAKYSKTALEL